jgi:NADPH2:quinone reductase
MRAIVVTRFGGPEVLEWAEVGEPEPGRGEVRIAVRAAGVNPVDAQNRADGTWAGVRPPWIPGYEVAGVVDHLGAGVDTVSVGDRVMAMTHFRRHAGGYAEFVALPAEAVAVLPDGVPYRCAAVIPVAAGTAFEVLRRLRLVGGERLLVLGASGGVGSFLLQLAAARGVDVVGVGQAQHHSRMLDLGAMTCADYTQADGARSAIDLAGGQVDAIADLVGGNATSQWMACLRHGGQIASIETPELDLGELLDANVTLHGVLLTNDGDRTRCLARLLARGQLAVHLSHVMGLSEAAQAHRILESRHAGGKIALITESESGSGGPCP